MATLAESLVSSTSRRLTLRMRPDLTARQQRYHGSTYWVVKEPVALNYYRFHEEEFAILCMLDGNSSLEEIKERFESEFTPQKITFADLQQFVGMLHRSGLVISDAAGQGQQLKRRRDQKKRKELLGKFSNIFAIRFRGFDPERFLNWSYPYIAWCFHPLAMLLCLLLGLAAASLVLVEFDVFRSRLPTFHQFFGPSNWIYLGITMALVKVLHEFGHGYSCKHYGGECHEIGLMLLVFTPCLYCNVSDSWMLPNKWHRAFIGAAGIYVELVLASLATFVWWFSDPHSTINNLALSIMFICSVSTVFFNGNPLLRFDGYYILMDLAEIPNLRQKSTEVLKRYMLETCLGLEQPENPFLPQQNRFLFGLYTVAAVIYRWVVVFSIMYFLTKILEPYGLKVIGQAMALAGLFGLVVQPLYQMVKFFYLPGRMHKVKPLRVAATLAVVSAIIAGIVFIPLPFHIACTFDVAPRGAEPVYPGVSGTIDQVDVQPGQEVQEGQVLARLNNLDLLLKIETLRTQKEVYESRLPILYKLAVASPQRSAVSTQIASIQESIVMVDKQLKEREAELAKLTIRAPVSGVVYPPPVKEDRDPGNGRLRSWSGFPFEEKNRGCFLQRQEQFCQIGSPTEYEAVLVIDQKDVDLLAEYRGLHDGAWPPVDMKLDAYRWATLSGQIEKLATAAMESAPESLSTQAGGDLATKTDRQGVNRPLSTSYQARVPLDNTTEQLHVGLTGKAKIYTGWQPIWRRVARYLYNTFHFDL